MNANPAPGQTSGVQLLTWTRFADLRSYKYFSCKKLVEAGGVRIFSRTENTQVIEDSKSTKRSRIRNCAKLERIWNADPTTPEAKLTASSPAPICNNFRVADSSGVDGDKRVYQYKFCVVDTVVL